MFVGKKDAAIRFLRIDSEPNFCAYPSVDRDVLLHKIRDSVEFKACDIPENACRPSGLFDVVLTMGRLT